jgi:hypothetical protein
MGRKRAKATETAAPETGGGLSKYQAVKRLVESQPDISRTDVVKRLRAEGIDISVDMASSYASKARKEIGAGGSSKRRPGRPPRAAAAARETAPARPAATGLSADDVVSLADLVRRVGADEVVRIVEAIR